MSKTDIAVAVYDSHTQAEDAVHKLAKADFDMKTISILGKDYHSEEHVVGYFNTGAKAAESWARKSYDQAGYELKAAAHGLESAATWTGTEAKAAASTATADARAVGDKLASGGVWAKNEVTKGFDSLGGALNKLGQSIGSKSKASPFDVGP